MTIMTVLASPQCYEPPLTMEVHESRGGCLTGQKTMIWLCHIWLFKYKIPHSCKHVWYFIFKNPGTSCRGFSPCSERGATRVFFYYTECYISHSYNERFSISHVTYCNARLIKNKQMFHKCFLIFYLCYCVV